MIVLHYFGYELIITLCEILLHFPRIFTPSYVLVMVSLISTSFNPEDSENGTLYFYVISVIHPYTYKEGSKSIYAHILAEIQGGNQTYTKVKTINIRTSTLTVATVMTLVDSLCKSQRK